MVITAQQLGLQIFYRIEDIPAITEGHHA
jgi:hypothetical protein